MTKAFGQIAVLVAASAAAPGGRVGGDTLGQREPGRTAARGPALLQQLAAPARRNAGAAARGRPTALWERRQPPAPVTWRDSADSRARRVPHPSR